jgi:heme ABC exporter ATP-binding subunit CcmA
MELAIYLRDAIALAGGFPALAGVDLQVSEGELVVLRGPNGAGKTTLLRLCAGLVPLASGEARVLGTDLAVDSKKIRRAVAFLGPRSFLYDDLTVDENLRFWGMALGIEPSDLRAAAHELGLDSISLGARTDRLSTGQRRRVELALVVARRSPLWLLDEPHAGLDTQGRDVIDDLIDKAVNAGATVLVASHESERNGTAAARVVHLDGGRVVDVREADTDLSRNDAT